MPREFEWLVLVGPVWLLVFLTFQAVTRKRSGGTLFMPKTPVASEQQTWISLGSVAMFAAKNCAWVRLTDTTAVVGLHFPFNVAIPRFVIQRFGFEATVPLESITRLEERHSALLGSGLTIGFCIKGAPDSITLWTSRRDTFARKLTDMARRRGAAV